MTADYYIYCHSCGKLHNDIDTGFITYCKPCAKKAQIGLSKPKFSKRKMTAPKLAIILGILAVILLAIGYLDLTHTVIYGDGIAVKDDLVELNHAP